MSYGVMVVVDIMHLMPAILGEIAKIRAFSTCPS